MRKLVAAACLATAVTTACVGDEPAAAPTPAPSYRPGEAPAYRDGGILGPAGDARDVSDQLEERNEELGR